MKKRKTGNRFEKVDEQSNRFIDKEPEFVTDMKQVVEQSKSIISGSMKLAELTSHQYDKLFSNTQQLVSSNIAEQEKIKYISQGVKREKLHYAVGPSICIWSFSLTV